MTDSADTFVTGNDFFGLSPSMPKSAGIMIYGGLQMYSLCSGFSHFVKKK